MMRGKIHGLTALIGAVALMLMLSPAAQATIVESGRYADSESFSFDDCGFLIDSEVEFSGAFKLRVDKATGGQAFLFSDNFEYREVLTNHETGEWFVVRGNGLFKEVKATHVEGDVYSFRAHEAGQPFVVENSDGKVVLRDRGLIVREVLFDTLGDSAPGGVLISVTVEAVHGPHPGFGEEFDFCALAQELIG